jgi:holo-[acyl-carrier protein] synthase
MILGIGIDLVEIRRFENNTVSEAFLKKVFTDKEIEECQAKIKTAISFAEKFVIKEAFMKAIGAGIGQEVWFTNIEVLNDKTGLTQITPTKKAKNYFEKLNVNQILVSFSSSSTLSVGVVILI